MVSCVLTEQLYLTVIDVHLCCEAEFDLRRDDSKQPYLNAIKRQQ